MQGVLKARGRRGEDCLLREDSGIRANNRSFLHTLTTTKKRIYDGLSPASAGLWGTGLYAAAPKDAALFPGATSVFSNSSLKMCDSAGRVFIAQDRRFGSGP